MRARLGLLLLALAVAPFAFPAAKPAVTVPVSSVLTWTAPSANTDGSALAGALTYNIYAQYVASGSFTEITTGVTALTYTDTSASLADGVNACYEVTAVSEGVESAPSGNACKNFPKGTPVAPSNLVVK